MFELRWVLFKGQNCFRERWSRISHTKFISSIITLFCRNRRSPTVRPLHSSWIRNNRSWNKNNNNRNFWKPTGNNDSIWRIRFLLIWRKYCLFQKFFNFRHMLLKFNGVFNLTTCLLYNNQVFKTNWKLNLNR